MALRNIEAQSLYPVAEGQVNLSRATHFYQKYPYSSAWIKRPYEIVNGKVESREGELAPHARRTEKGRVYIVDVMEEVLAGRELLVDPDLLLRLMRCDYKGPNDERLCGEASRALILNNGRWQNSIQLKAVCENESHTKGVMGALTDSLYEDDWDFWNPPVFGIYIPSKPV